MWLTLDDSHLTDDEYEVGKRLASVIETTGAATVQVTVLDEDVQPSTTVLVVRRPGENLMLVVRADRSTVVATDDIYANRWRDPESAA